MYDDFDYYSIDNDSIFNNYDLRESIIREMSEQELWDTFETVPEDLLANY
jgi:hypothetical protein